MVGVIIWMLEPFFGTNTIQEITLSTPGDKVSGYLVVMLVVVLLISMTLNLVAACVTNAMAHCTSSG